MWQLIFGMLMGAIATIAVQLLLIRKFLSRSADVPPARAPQFVDYKLPLELRDALSSPYSGNMSKEALPAVNTILQFLFQEHKDANPALRKWVLQKIKAECEELQHTNKVIRMVNDIKVWRVSVGENLPVLRSVALGSVKMSSDGRRLEEIDVTADVEYNGGCRVVLGVSLPLDKRFRLSVQVKSLSGTVRLHFSRTPYTHWWFSFLSEPRIDLDVQSHLQGRSIPHITSLFVSQIKKAIRRKHTLPSYKMRVKPFFGQLGMRPTPSSLSSSRPADGQRLLPSTAVVTAIVASRLPASAASACRAFYCALALGKTPYTAEAQAKTRLCFALCPDDQHRARGLRLGRNPGVREDDGHPVIVVSRVTRGSSAQKAGLLKDDVIFTIDGVMPLSCEHAEKLLQGHETLNVMAERDFSSASYPHSKAARMSDAVPAVCVTDSVQFDSSGAALAEFERSMSELSEDGSTILVERQTSTPGDDFVLLTYATSGSPSASDTAGICANGRPIATASTESSASVAAAAADFTGIAEASQRGRPTSGSGGSSGGSSGGCINIPSSPRRRYRGSAGDNDYSVSASGLGSSTAVSDSAAIAVWKNCSLRTALASYVGQPCVSWRERLPLSIEEEELLHLTVFVIGVTASGSEQLVGYVNVSLPDVIAECQDAAGHEYQIMLSLLPGSGSSGTRATAATAASESGRQVSAAAGAASATAAIASALPAGARGLERGRACGDVTLRFYLPGASNDVATMEDEDNAGFDDDDDDGGDEDSTAPVVRATVTSAVGTAGQEHAFVSTLFQQATYCDFCRRKIWFKNALKCTGCSMACHKKCQAQCRVQLRGGCPGTNRTGATQPPLQPPAGATSSSRSSASSAQQLSELKAQLPGLYRKIGRITRRVLHEPEVMFARGLRGDFGINSRAAADGQMSTSAMHASQLLSPASAAESGSGLPLRRTHSASALESATRQVLMNQSSASPGTTPRSTEGAQRSGDEASTDEESELESNLISFLKQQEAANSLRSEEAVVTAAKEMGKELYLGLEPIERQQKLENMVAKLQQEIDMETQLKAEVAASLPHAVSDAQRKVINEKVLKSDEKIEALAVLLLHYCSGLQHCFEQLNQAEGATRGSDVSLSKKDV